jgi:hypothetical protein
MMSPLEAAGAVATSASAVLPPPAVTPLDDTAESVPDTAASLADVVARRAELLVIAAQSEQQVLQARLDRMRATFNAAQEVRSERLRQMNMLRDMAMEQAKHDDEILKKYIAMI